MFSIVSEEQGALLLSIPFFTFMGAILERSGLAEDLLDSIGQLFGPVRGGLSYAVIFVGAILGAITGTVAASVIAMAVIALPLMLRYGYSTRHATGVIAASGTITQLIPPSLVLIVLAGQLGQSVGAMYAGAIGPSLIQIGLFCAWVLIVSLIWPQRGAGAAAGGAHAARLGAVEQMPARHRPLARADVPGAGHDLFRPRDADRGRRHGRGRRAAARGVQPPADLAAHLSGDGDTMRITAMVVFILIGARVFSLVFQGVGGKVWIEDWLTSLPGGVIGFLIFVNIFIFVLAFFLDFFEIAFIVVPLLAPVAAKLGIDLVWFGLMICANIQTSFMHPPFGFALFYLRGVAPPTVRTADIYWGAVPWVVLQVILVAILIFWPQSVTYWIDARRRSIRRRSRSKFRCPTCRPAAADRARSAAAAGRNRAMSDADASKRSLIHSERDGEPQAIRRRPSRNFARPLNRTTRWPQQAMSRSRPTHRAVLRQAHGLGASAWRKESADARWRLGNTPSGMTTARLAMVAILAQSDLADAMIVGMLAVELKPARLSQNALCQSLKAGATTPMAAAGEGELAALSDHAAGSHVLQRELGKPRIDARDQHGLVVSSRAERDCAETRRRSAAPIRRRQRTS